MNPLHATTPIPDSLERHHEADTRLSGRWLLIGRGAWVSLVLLTLAIFVVLVPSYFAQLQTVCSSPTCALVQPTPDTVQAIQQLGLSISGYATFTFVLTLVTAGVCFLVSGVTFRQKSDDWMALLVALTEVVSGSLFVTYALVERSPGDCYPGDDATFLCPALAAQTGAAYLLVGPEASRIDVHVLLPASMSIAAFCLVCVEQRLTFGTA